MRTTIGHVTLLLAAVFSADPLFAQETTRVSVASNGTEGNGHSFIGSMSSNGRFVAFLSAAGNLVASDTNGVYDVFVRDRAAGQTQRVSVSSSGAQGNAASLYPSISGDGRFVAFESSASNLVSEDTNGVSDVFVHDRVNGQTTRVSISSAGVQGNGVSEHAAISADGRFVAFNSTASSLVVGDANSERDVFLHDRDTAETIRIGKSSGGSQNLDGQFFPVISSDGRFVAFQSGANDLVEGDTNMVQDVFVYDRILASIERVSLDGTAQQGTLASYNPAISSDGRFVAFDSQAGNLVAGDTNSSVDVFVRDRQLGTTERVSVATGGGQATGFSGNANKPSLSADGRFVAFGSLSSNLVPDDTNNVFDRFLHDRSTGVTTRVSVSTAGAQVDTEGGSGGGPMVSAEASVVVAFDSFATNLVLSDLNSVSDVFVRDLGSVDRIFGSGFEF